MVAIPSEISQWGSHQNLDNFIAVNGIILTGLMTGIMMNLVIYKGWLFGTQAIFGAMSVTVYSMDALVWFKESNVETKYVTSLLHGECLLGSACAVFIFDFLTATKGQWVVHWYQYAMGILRIILFGIPLGYSYGLVGSALMKYTYSDAGLLIILTLSMCYTSFFLSSWCSNSGLIGASISGIMMSMEKASLSQEMQENIISFWKLICSLLTGIIVIMVGVRAPFILLLDLHFKEYMLILVTYMMSNIARFISFFLFSPILSRLGYGMSFQTMIICVWCGLKNPIIFTQVLDLQNLLDQKETKQIFFIHMVGLYFLTLIINGGLIPILLRALGLSEISIARQLNMNNCMKYIYEARARTIAILKMDRFLSDANWPLVLSSTALKHPYNKTSNLNGENTEDEETQFFMGYKFTWCPDCQKHIPNEPTPKELKEMTKEAKMRLLKLKKTCYSRQYENGMLSREGVRTLHQAIEIAMDTDEAYVELDGLFLLFEKESTIYKYFQTNMQNILLSRDGALKMPKSKCRLFCYMITNNLAFFIIMNIVVCINLAYLIPQLWLKEEMPHSIGVAGGICFLIIYVTECVLKVLGLSWNGIRSGVVTYFSTVWTILEFIIILYTIVAIILETLICLRIMNNSIVNVLVGIGILTLRCINILTRLKLSTCCRPLNICISKYLDAKVNKHKALAYELGKNYIAGEEEILENLNQIIDNLNIRAHLKQKTEEDRLSVGRRLGLSQKQKAWLASTVKTKIAIRTVLNSMKEDVYELKVSGWVDDVEYNKLLASLQERYKFIGSIKYVDPSTPVQIFKEILYLGEDSELIEFLYSNIATKKYDPGVVVIEEGDVSDGIYIIITGMFEVTYIPNDEVETLLKEHGALPVVDFICSNDYKHKCSDLFVPGNTLGELSTITRRPYNGKITSETHSEVYFISGDILKRAFLLDIDPVNGFECRIWKTIAFKRAVDIFMTVPAYRSVSQDKIKFLLQKAFVPNLSNYKVFIINEMIQDTVVIEGAVIDFNTRDVYTAPCYVPRTVQKLILPKSIINVHANIEVKLLILPSKDFDEYEIMMAEEQCCELISLSSTKCLRHLIQEKIAVNSKVSKQQKGLFSNATKRLRKRLLGAESTKSKITFAAEGKGATRSTTDLGFK